MTSNSIFTTGRIFVGPVPLRVATSNRECRFLISINCTNLMSKINLSFKLVYDFLSALETQIAGQAASCMVQVFPHSKPWVLDKVWPPL